MVKIDEAPNGAPPTPGILLAGGLARRMGGGDKPMRLIAGRTILDRVIARLGPQCDRPDPQRQWRPGAVCRDLACPSIADSVVDFPGPLAGILAGLDWAAAHRPEASCVLSAAADCPFLPRDLVARLHHGPHRTECAARGRRLRRTDASVIGLWSVALRESFATRSSSKTSARSSAGPRAIRLATVTWPTEPLDPFFNANTADDLAEAERLAALDGG